jgi:hypothetical protein
MLLELRLEQLFDPLLKDIPQARLPASFPTLQDLWWPPLDQHQSQFVILKKSQL